MKDAHVTIYHVAARAGVSAATASRALAGLKVSTASLESVQRAAADLGYVPNEAARSLRVVRTMTVGMVFNRLTSRLGIELLDSLASRLDEMGYSLFVSTAGGDEGRYEQLVRRFLERRVDALICVHGHGSGEALDRYLAAGVPAISLITQAGGYRRLPLITPSIAEAAQHAVADLIQRGYGGLGLLTSRTPAPFMDEFARIARKAGMAVTSFENLESVIDAVRSGGSTAVLARQADAEQLAAAASAAELSGRLQVVAIRDRNMAPPPAGKVSVLEVDPSVMGRAAAEALRGWLDDKTALVGVTRVSSGRWQDNSASKA